MSFLIESVLYQLPPGKWTWCAMNCHVLPSFNSVDFRFPTVAQALQFGIFSIVTKTQIFLTCIFTHSITGKNNLKLLESSSNYLLRACLQIAGCK